MNIRLALTLTLLTPLAAHAAAQSSSETAVARAPTSIAPSLHVFGSRSAQQLAGATGAKLDAALAELARNLGQVSTRSAVSDLHSLSPGARFMQRASDPTPLVLIDAVTRGDARQLKNTLVALGLQKPSVYSNVVSGWLPVNQIEAATTHAELHSMNAAMFRTRAGAISTQGDFAQNSAALRSTYSMLDGTGVTVGALSDSYNCYPVYAANNVPASGYAGYATNGFLNTATNDVASADLPAGVNVVAEATCMSYGYPIQLPFADEGRAILQLIHDVAPGAGLAFYTVENGEADFANGITTLASTAHAKVIIDDVGFFDEPFFQDGLIAQAVDGVYGQGVAYFSSAGNDAQNSYENTTPSFTTLSTTAPNAGEYLLNFDNSRATTTTSLPINVPSLQPGWLIALILQWDQPYVKGAAGSPGATSHLDLCITGSGTDKVINLSGNTVTCTGPNSTGADPVQILIVSNPANATAPTAAETINVFIGLAGGTAAPGRIKLAIGDNGIGATVPSTSSAYPYTKNPTLQGHPGAAGAAAVGAAPFYKTPACGVSPAVLEVFSSQGGSPILFDKTGARLATPLIRQKPDFVAPDRGNNTFFGHKLAAGADQSTVIQCANDQNYPNFAGTSAAAPHAAAVAALMLQANSTLTAPQIYTALRTTASPMTNYTADFVGSGFIQADAALTSLASLPPGTPTLSFSSSSVATGASTTLKWMSINTTSCTASGGWTGSQSTSGSATITAPATAGTTNYTLTCSNASGSAAATATLTATAQSSGGGGGGGGAIDQIVVLVLAGLIAARRPWAPAPRPFRRSCRATPAGRHRSRSTGSRGPRPPVTGSN